MIVSASRRCDIPAHYSPWLLGRLEAGYCLVRNPFDARRSTRVSLEAQDLDFIAFWTRDPRPLTPHLRELDGRGIRSYLQVTLTAYPIGLEPGAESLEESLRAFRELAAAIGARRALWRYDPIFVAEGLDADFHRRAFERIAASLEGCTERVTLSLLDEYAHTGSRLARAGYPGALFGSPRAAASGGAAAGAAAGKAGPPDPYPSLLADLAAIARSRGMVPVACAEPYDLGALGIGAAACVDSGLAASIWGGEFPAAKAGGQRPECGCAMSVDIGAYGLCPRGCVYCYANRGRGRLAARGPDDEAL
jgi:hypothetical protein